MLKRAKSFSPISTLPGRLPEKVYWHYQADAYGYVTAAVVNRRHNNGQGLGVYIRYKKTATLFS